MSAAVDHLIARVRGPDAGPDGGDGGLRAALGRFPVVKASWRGRYRRLLSVTPSCIVTQQPDTLAVTHVWRFSGDDPDVAAVDATGGLGPPGAAGEHELTLTVRSDAKVRRGSGWRWKVAGSLVLRPPNLSSSPIPLSCPVQIQAGQADVPRPG